MPGNSYSNPYADPSNPFQNRQPSQPRQPGYVPQNPTTSQPATKRFSSSLPAEAQRDMPAIRQRTSREKFPQPLIAQDLRLWEPTPGRPKPWEPTGPTPPTLPNIAFPPPNIALPPYPQRRAISGTGGVAPLDGNRAYAAVITQGPNGRWYPDADTSGPGFASREEMRQAMLAKRRAAGGGVQGMPAIRTNRVNPAQPIVPASAMQDPLTPAERQFVTQQGQSQLRQFQSATDAYGNPWSSYGANGPVSNGNGNGWEMYPIGHPLHGTL